MSNNKGKKLVHCQECNRRRYCSKRSVPNNRREWTCSKGHKWIIDLPTVERISNAIKDTLLPKVSNLFERDDTFYTFLKRR